MLVKVVDDDFLDQLVIKAVESSRKRHTENLSNTDSNLQALYTAICMSSYMRPHRHPNRSEIISPIRGKFGVILFNDIGEITEHYCLGSTYAVREIFIEKNTWHTLIALSPNVVIANPTEGPYDKENHSEYASWAPKEDDANFIEYWLKLRKSIV